MREHARLIQLEARLLEMEQRLASQTRGCETTSEPHSVAVETSRDRPKTDPLRSQGDFLAEAHPATPAVVPPAAGAPATGPSVAAPAAAKVALAESPQPATPASERQRLEQLLEGLREYGFDPQNGLSNERREALRVLLRHERQLDLMNPWGGR